jgi:hypothetical protein
MSARRLSMRMICAALAAPIAARAQQTVARDKPPGNPPRKDAMTSQKTPPSQTLALRRFVEKHPPRQPSPVADDLIDAYTGKLPGSLLELWRRGGLGLYGERQLALIDPRRWQPILDRWIISPPDSTRRVPIALTPFGKIIYYRKLSATQEDVAFLDPVSKKTDVLSWSFDECFNSVLCDEAALDALVEPDWLAAARRDSGVLAPGEVYEIDQTLYTALILRIRKVDALDLHRRLRDAVDPPVPKDTKPGTVREALPAAHRALFEGVASGPGLSGLYLSSYIDWHRMLALRPDGRYDLLFWKIHHQTFERQKARAYRGSYRVSRAFGGDEVVELAIALRQDSLGSDANDQRLIVMRSGGTTFLLNDPEDMAIQIVEDGVMGHSDHYFFQVRLDDAFVQEPSDGRPAPPRADMPYALRSLIPAAKRRR